MQESNRTTDQTLTVEDQITEELIAARAYERWQHRGCPLGEQEQDWFAARAELEEEIRHRMQRERLRTR